MTTVFEYPIQGGTIPQDNGYLIMSALSKDFPFLHGQAGVQIAPVRGTRTKSNNLSLDRRSILHIRGISAEQAAEIAGSWIMVQGVLIGIGPVAHEVVDASSYLVSRLVILRGMVGEAAFRQCLATRLPDGVHVRLGKRRGLRIKGRVMLGYPVHLSGLTEDASLDIQGTGIGKYTSMGCGVFYPGRGGHLRGLPKA